MLRKLAAGTLLAGIGFLVGSTMGFRAAVVDYVENDAKLLRESADTIYGDGESQSDEDDITFEINGEDFSDQLSGGFDDSDTDSDDKGPAFQ